MNLQPSAARRRNEPGRAGTRADLTPSAVEVAILQTLLYSDVFDYPLTAPEIHHRLIGVAETPEAVRAALHGSRWLSERIERVNGYFAVSGRREVIAIREARSAASVRLWRQARFFGRLIAQLPFVRLLAVTGALAVDNSDPGDDIDLLVVTEPGRVWLARALCIVVVRLARLVRVHLCPNYLLSEAALVEVRRDLFAAYELAQMAPLSGHRLYLRLRTLNAWSAQFLPNAHGPLRSAADLTPHGLGRVLQQTGEWLLGGKLGDALERWERQRKLARFASKSRQPSASAVLDAERIKGHFEDYGRPALDAFVQRLQVRDLTVPRLD